MRTESKPNKQDAAYWASNRKWTVLQHLISTLSKISILKNIAVVILQQTATKMRDGAGAVLVPSISSTAWDAGIASRIVLFQDWGPEHSKESVRYAGVLKAEGILGPSNGGLGRVVPFAILEVRFIIQYPYFKRPSKANSYTSPVSYPPQYLPQPKK